MRASLLAAMAAVVLAAPASAAVVTFENITGTWYDAQGGTIISNSGAGSEARIRWGTPSAQSGYDFEALGIPALTVAPPGGSDYAAIGTFRHINYGIPTGTSIESVKLLFTADIKVDGALYDTVNFVYSFGHNETPNNASPCANGLPNNKGINDAGCADQVKVNFNSQSEFFIIELDGINYEYALDVDGFYLDSDFTDVATSFWTREEATNEAWIRGRLTLYSDAAAVPEPATWAMLIAGFGMVGASMRRRQRGIVRATS